MSQEPRHHKRYENEHLRVLEVIIESGDTTLFHEHALDLAAVYIRGAEIKNEEPNNPEAKIIQLKTGRIGFAANPKPYVHRVTTMSPEALVVIGFEILVPAPGGFAVSDRNGAPRSTTIGCGSGG